MNETSKTAVFLTLAVVFIGIAFAFRSSIREIKIDEMVDEVLFPEFDELNITTLEIVRLDSLDDPIEFRLAEVDGVWLITSHGNYPADANEPMGKVAEALADLKVLEVKQLEEGMDKTTFHATYGVIDPTSEAMSLGKGIGIKVKLGGSANKTLVDLIIEGEDNYRERKNADDIEEEDNRRGEENVSDLDKKNNLRYVRIAGQTPVYVVEIDRDRFSPRFDQWIEKNLLDINTSDLRQIYIDEDSLRIEYRPIQTRDGVALQGMQIVDSVGDMLLRYDDGSAVGAEKWTLEQATRFNRRNNDYVDTPLKPDEELNTEVLDAMVFALNDLKIVDVAKKTSVLAAALKSAQAIETIESDESATSLAKHGFYLVPTSSRRGGTTAKRVQLRPAKGHLQLRMKDGIRYNIYFGKLTGTESEVDKPEDIEDPTKPKDEPTMGANRYLFITVEFDSSMIPPPDIKEVPEVPTEGEDADIEKAQTEKEQIEKINQRDTDRYNAAIKAGQERAKKLTDKFADWYYVIPENVYKKIHFALTDIVQEKKQNTHGHDCDCNYDCDCNHSDADERLKTFPVLPGMDGMLTIPGLDEAPKIEEPTDSETTEEAFDPFGGESP